jgi:hypothetical protein
VPRVYADEDAEYLRCLEEERIELVGPPCEYYSLNRGTNVDPLYGEPDNDPLYGGSSPRGTPQIDEKSWNFYPNPYADPVEPTLTFPVHFEYTEADNRQPMVRDEGFHAEYDAIMHLSINHWEKAIAGTRIDGRVPKEGDVLYCFNEWWDVVRVGSGGNVVDTPVTVGWKFELRKRTKFTPDRKVDR